MNINILNILKAEFKKINHWADLLVLSLIALFIVLFAFLIIKSDTETIVGKNAFDILFYDMSFKLYVLLALPLITVIFTSKAYSLEFHNKTKRTLYTMPVERSTFFFTKLSVVLLYNIYSIIFLAVSYLLLRTTFTSNLNISSTLDLMNLFNYTILGIIAITLAVIPVSIFHLWLSSRKISLIYNIYIYIGIYSISLAMYSKYIVNQWYNFYLFPYFFHKQIFIYFKDHFIDSRIEYFSAHNYPFLMFIVIISIILALVSSKYFIDYKDKKY